MQEPQIERRGTSAASQADGPYADATRVVREGMAIQSSLGTRSAVEYMKQHGIHGAVIHRVLVGEQVRSEDQPALEQNAR